MLEKDNFSLEKIIKCFKNSIYLIIPLSCLIIWALIYLINQNFSIHQSGFHGDFWGVYRAGKIIISNPQDLYDPEYDYNLLPIFALLVAVSFCLLPFPIANLIYYFINVIFSLIFTFLFDCILKLKDVKNKTHRFFFLMIISNGFAIYYQFYQSNYKYIVGVILLFVFERELKYQIENKIKSFKFYLLNLSLLVFAVAVFFYIIFFLLIYLFKDYNYKEIFKKQKVINYLIVIIMFAVQNFYFFIYPSYFIGILNLYFVSHTAYESLYYLAELNEIFVNNIVIILISFFVMFFISLVLIINKKLKLEEKFSYFSVFSLIFATFAQRAFVILLPFIILLFIRNLNKNIKGFNFCKENFFFLFGMIAIIAIYFDISISVIFTFFPIFEHSFFIFLIYLRRVIFVCFLELSLLISHLKYKKSLIKSNIN